MFWVVLLEIPDRGSRPVNSDAAACSVVTVSLFSRSVGVSLKKSVVGVGVF